MIGMNRPELADFLRGRRARVQPVAVGLPSGVRRRTPGLRREEVAHLAGISVDYYARLEQARGPRPSRQVLSALARALRLQDDERDHLYRLAGEVPGPPAGLSREVSPGILHLLDRLEDTPAFVLDAKYDVLAWNRMAAALMGDLSALAAADRNIVWKTFCGPCAVSSPPPPETEQFLVEIVSDLRAATAKYPHDPGIQALVARLRAGSPEFARRWGEHRVCVHRHSTSKRMYHPLVGEFTVDCEILHMADRDQRLVIYTTAPGSPGADALRLLAVVGTQDMAAT